MRPAKSLALGADERNFLRLLLLVVAAITIVRGVVLFLSPLELAPDEAQYWDWSRDFAFGYFSKPPMIAWVIGLASSVCGSGEACLRLPSPLLHGATSIVLFFLARSLFDTKTGFWVGVTYCLLPGISFSSGLISTDVPLLFFWSVSLLSFERVLATRKPVWFAVFGVALGLGFMSKYAMIYFPLGMALFVLVSPADRKILADFRLYAALGLALLILAPNLLWNANNDFTTFSHTAANANWRDVTFNFEGTFDFLADQIAIIGPLFFLALIYLSFRTLANFGAQERGVLYVLPFVLPPLVIILGQGFISRANGNWAAVAYPAATVLVVALLIQLRAWWVIHGSTALHAVAALFLYALSVNLTLVEQVGMENAFKRVRGWSTFGEYVNGLTMEHNIDALLIDDRLFAVELLYYGQPASDHMYMWDYNGVPDSHYELKATYAGQTDGPLLLISRGETPPGVVQRFSQSERLAPLTVPLGGTKERVVHFHIVEGFDK